MNSSYDEYIGIIDVPELIKGSSDNKNSYYIFSKNRLQLLSRKAPFILILMIVVFIFTLQSKNNLYLYAVSNIVLLGAGIWYYYEARFMTYYKKAEKAFAFEHFDKMMNNLKKIIKSRKLYLYDMPLAYSILKAKELLLNGETDAADHLISHVIKVSPKYAEVKYIKGLCDYFSGNTESAKKNLSKIASQRETKEMSLCAQKIIDSIG